MDYYTFIGTLVVGLGVIISLFIAVYKPLAKIEHRLTKIEDNLESINNTLGGHSTTLKEHEKRITQNEGDIKVLKMKNHKKGY